MPVASPSASLQAASTSGASPARKKARGGGGAAEGSDGDGLTALEASFLPRALDEFLGVIEGNQEAGAGGALGPVQLRFVERFLEFLVDLLGQLPTRRFLKVRERES